MTAYRETMGQVLQRMYDNKQLQIQERELSDTELKRREEIAKELPDEEFKDRYGSRWKEVKLATATKQAKSESVEEEKLEKMDEAAGFSAGMISKLKKSYSTLKKIDPTSPTAKKLFGVLDKMNKEQLIQIVKADINFLSLLAANRLIKDHNMKGAEINKLKESIRNEGYKPVKDNHYDVKVTLSDKEVKDVEKFIMNSPEYNKGDIEDVDMDQVMGGGMKFKGTGDIFIQGDDAGSLGVDLQKKFGRKIKVVGEETIHERSRQLKDPKKEMMISYKGSVMVINKKDWPKYEKKGAVQAEQLAKIKGNTPAADGRRAATQDDIDRAEKKGDKKLVKKLKEEVELDESVIDKVKEIASKKSAAKIDGVMVDSFSASAISQIYDKVNDANKKKMEKLPITKLANLAFKMMQKNDYVPEEAELDEAKYDIYHKDFSSAMQHAYKAAKKMYGITVDPKEIDDKVATGPRKPSKGKTNSYRLKGDKGAIQVQVANLDNKKYELNMYKESHEMGTDEYRKYLEDLTPHSTESARSDAMRAMRRDKSMIRGKDSADVDDVATKDDRKAASKNILQQLKKTLDTKGKTDIEFLDKKKKKVPYDIAVKAVKKYMGFRNSTDKLKFQQALAKSYKSMLQAVKEDYVVPKTHSESILDRIDTKLKEKKNG